MYIIYIYILPSVLNAPTCPLILVIIRTNGQISLSKYLIKYLQLVFLLTNFEITILSTLTFKFFISFSSAKSFSFAIFVFAKLFLS